MNLPHDDSNYFPKPTKEEGKCYPGRATFPQTSSWATRIISLPLCSRLPPRFSNLRCEGHKIFRMIKPTTWYLVSYHFLRLTRTALPRDEYRILSSSPQLREKRKGGGNKQTGRLNSLLQHLTWLRSIDRSKNHY